MEMTKLETLTFDEYIIDTLDIILNLTWGIRDTVLRNTIQSRINSLLQNVVCYMDE
jgi:hypothetical protein